MITGEGRNSKYNDDKVFYCKQCLSLKVRHIPSIKNSEYCDKCGSTDIETCSIEEWESYYKNKYGYNYLEEY